MIDRKTIMDITGRLPNIESLAEGKCILAIADLAGDEFKPLTIRELSVLTNTAKTSVRDGIARALDHGFITMRVSPSGTKEYRIRQTIDIESVIYTQVEVSHVRKVRKSKSIKGYVYLIQMCGFGDFHKIGKAKSVKNRMGLFNVKLPFDWELIHTFPADDYTLAENALHRQFADRLINGEWFDLTPEDVDYIKSIAEYSDGEFIISEVIK